MDQMSPLQSLQTLTQELRTFSDQIQTQNVHEGRNYQVIFDKLSEQAQKIKEIYKECIGEAALNEELEHQILSAKSIQTLLPPPQVGGDQKEILTYFKSVLLIKTLREAQVINKMAIAFKLSEQEIRDLIPPNSDKGLFLHLAEICCQLATAKLMTGETLSFSEIKAIHEALFDSSVQRLIPPSTNSSFIKPNPIEVFDSLFQFLSSVEATGDFETIQNQIDTVWKEYFPPDDYNACFRTTNAFKACENYLNSSREEQKERLSQLPSEQHRQNFLQNIAFYQEFKEKIASFPVVDAKKMLLDSNNINETFFLNVNGNTQWVFKPTLEAHEEFGYMQITGTEGIMEAECSASQLNSHGLFPIPLTISLQIKDRVGSAQMYVKNAQKLAKLDLKTCHIDTNQLQKLVIFDLMFANTDRNDANFLFQIVDNKAHIVGIDHDQCLMFRGIQERLKFEYLHFEELKEPLQEEMLALFSEEAIQHYRSVLADNEDMLIWMNTVVEKLRTAIAEKTPLIDVIKDLEEAYQERNNFF